MADNKKAATGLVEVPKPPKLSKKTGSIFNIFSKNKKSKIGKIRDLEEELDKKKYECRVYVDKKVNDLIEREKEVMASHKQLSREQHKWRKEEAVLKKNIELLQRKKNILEKEFEEHEEIIKAGLLRKSDELKQVESRFEQKQKILEDDKKLLLEKEQNIIEKTREFEKLKQLSDSVYKREQLIKAREDAVNSKEKEFDKKLKDTANIKNKLEKETAFLMDKKSLLQLDVANSKKELEAVRKEHSIKINEIKDAESVFGAKEDEINAKLKLLKKEEDLVKKIAEREKLVTIREKIVKDNEKNMQSNILLFDRKKEGLEKSISKLADERNVLQIQARDAKKELDSLVKDVSIKNSEIEKAKKFLADVEKKDKLVRIKEELVRNKEREAYTILNKKEKIENEVNRLIEKKGFAELSLSKIRKEMYYSRKEIAEKEKETALGQRELLRKNEEIKKKMDFLKNVEKKDKLVRIKEELVRNKEREAYTILNKKEKIENEVNRLIEKKGFAELSLSKIRKEMYYSRKEIAEKEKETALGQRELLRKNEEIKKKMDFLKENEKKIKQISEREKLIIARENLMNESEKIAEKDIVKLMKNKTHLENEIVNLTGNEKSANDSIRKSRWELDVIKKELSEKQKEFEASRSELDSIKLREKELADKEKEVDSKLKQVDKNRELLLKEEQKIKGKLKGLKGEGDKQKESNGMLLHMKKELDAEIAKKEGYLEGLRGEWNSMEDALEDSKKVLFAKKKGFEKLFKNNDKYVKIFEKMSKKEEALNKKGSYIKKMLPDIEQREKTIDAREESLRAAKELEYNIDDLSKKIMALTELYNSLKQRISEKSMVLNRLGRDEGELELRRKQELNELHAIEEDALIKELAIQREEKKIREKEDTLSAEEEALKNKEIIIEDRLRNIKDKEILEDIKESISPMPKVRQKESFGDIHSAIDEARNLVNRGQIAEATQALKRVQSMQKRIKLDEITKRKVGYDLVDLETDIKLASL